MGNSRKRGGIWAGMLALLLGIAGGISAAPASGLPEESTDTPRSADPEQEAAVEIWDAEGLRAMAENPSGAYSLAADIDMSGEAWTPFAFHGSLDGGGYSVLNLTVREPGAAVRETYDGNMKVYDTCFAGLFDELEGAEVRGLNLVNLRVDVETDLPCFIGGMAGYMENSRIENCSVQGILQLKAHDRMFGVGGIIGYGCGGVKDTRADVTLVCVDTDAASRDEQFMGGICAAGYPDINGCDVVISGFDSDHGYVHNGGLVGMYMFYPGGTQYWGSVTDNRVTGRITFFEDNTSRRAYCSAFIGEIVSWDFENGRNRDDFVRDEVFAYDVDLMPHACENPALREEVTAPGCGFGYTAYVCGTCGYRETDHYTLKAHDCEWTVLKEAGPEEEGLREGLCAICGETVRERIPMAAPEPAESPEPPADGDSGSAGDRLDGGDPAGEDGGAGGTDAAGDGANGGLTAAQVLIAASAGVVICAAVGVIAVIRIRENRSRP